MSGRRMTVELEREGLIRLTDLREARVACLDGAVWITEDCNPNDIVLEPGGVYRINRKGTILLALQRSRIAIEAPAEVLDWSALLQKDSGGWLPAPRGAAGRGSIYG